jgi:polygalacturonase
MHQGKNLKNVTIRGRGVVSGESFPYCGKCMDENMFEMEGDDLHMEGISIVGTPHFAMRFRKGKNHSVRNVKNIAWYASTDGIGSVGDDSLIEDCFIKVNDDHIKLYSKNLTVRNVIIWPYISGSPFQWGYGSGVDGSGTHVSNVDIINSGLGWREGGNRGLFCASKYTGSTNNYVFENIYIEGPVYRLIKLYGGGHISNVTFNNIVLTDPAQMENIVSGTYRDFTFIDLTIDGHVITQASDAFFPSPANIDNLQFIHTRDR